MIESLALTTTVVCVVAAVVVLVRAAGGHHRWAAVAPLLLILQIALLLQAVVDVVGLLRGHHPAETATHLAYLLTSLAVLPVATGQAGRDDGRWAGVLVGISLLAVAVVVVRMQTTWRSGSA